METKMKHGEKKSRHKYFGLGRVTSKFGVFAATALICVGLVSGTARGEDDEGIITKLDKVMADVQLFENKFETLVGNLLGVPGEDDGLIATAKDEIIANTDAAETAIIANTDAAETAIKANTDATRDIINSFIRDTHLVDPFDVAVNICTEIEGGAAIEGLAHLGIGANLEAHLGVNFYGSGAQIGIKPAGEIGVGIALRSDVETYVVACINGVFARQDQDLTEEAAVIASVVDQDEQDFIAELFEVGNNYRDRVMGTAVATKLVAVNVGNGFDRLNTSLDAFEGVTTLNAQKLGQFIVSSFDGNDTSSPLGDLSGDLSGGGSGTGIDTVMSDIAGMFDIGSGDFTSVNTAISTAITSLGLGTGGGGLSDMLDLSSVGTALTSFKGIDDAIDLIEDAIGDIEGVISGLTQDVADALGAIARCISSFGTDCDI